MSLLPRTLSLRSYSSACATAVARSVTRPSAASISARRRIVSFHEYSSAETAKSSLGVRSVTSLLSQTDNPIFCISSSLVRTMLNQCPACFGIFPVTKSWFMIVMWLCTHLPSLSVCVATWTGECGARRSASCRPAQCARCMSSVLSTLSSSGCQLCTIEYASQRRFALLLRISAAR